MVEADVEAELFLRVPALVRAAGDAHGAASLQLGDLSDRAADRPGGGRDDDRFAGLRLSDVEQAHVRGEAGHAEHAERPRRILRRCTELHETPAVGQRIVLPAAEGQHPFADGELRIVRYGDAAHRGADHHRIHRDRRRIGRRVAHAAAHVGIEREMDGTQQNLPCAGHRSRGFFEPEVGFGRCTVRTRCENDATVDLRGLGHVRVSSIPRGARPAARADSPGALWPDVDRQGRRLALLSRCAARRSGRGTHWQR